MPGPYKAARWMAGAAMMIATMTWCAAGHLGRGSSPQSQRFAEDGYQARLFNASDLVAAPPISGVTVSGAPLSLRSYRGHLVVLNFWGSWCAPCRAEAPALGTVARKLYPEGVRFMGVDTRDEPASARAFMHTFRVSYPSLSDPDAEIALAFRHTVPLAGLPDTVIINRAGRIAAAIIGAATYKTLMTLIAKVGTTR